MAEPEIEEKNPFDGMSFGQAVLKLKEQPELSPKFDAKFKDEEEYDTLERARLHLVNSYYRGTTAGASWLRNASILADPETWKNAPKNEPTSPYSVLLDVTNPARWNHLIPSQKDISDQYAAVIGDLAKYERMRPAQSWAEYGAAIGGGIAGGVPTPESLLSAPFRFIGATPVARIAEGALQGGIVNVATDPLVQHLNIGAGVQKDYDWFQTALQLPLGMVVGGGLVGAGQVLTNTFAKKTWKGMSVEDPQARTWEPEPLAARKIEDEKVNEVTPEEAPIKADPLKAEEPELAAASQDELGLSRVAPLKHEQSRPPTGVPRDPDEHIVKSQQQMVQGLEKDFDVDVRQGRVTMENALATYNLRTGVVRTKEYSDFEVATHETAHKIWRELGQDFDNFLRQWDNELKLLDYDQDPIFGQRYFEGFAEYVRIFMGNPATATRRAPGFTSEFLNYLEAKRPDYLTKLVDSAANYHEFLTAPSVDVLRATTKQADQRGWFERTTDTLKEEGLPGTIDNYAAKMYNGTFDRYSALPRAMRRAANEFFERNGKLATMPRGASNPELLWRALQRSGQTANEIIRSGVPDWLSNTVSGPSLRDALVAAHGAVSGFEKWNQKIVDDFNVYLVGREALNRWDQHNRGELEIAPHPMKADDIAQAMRDLDDAYPQFFHASELWLKFQRRYVQRLSDGGLPVPLEAINKQPFYAPMRRDVSDRPLAGDGDKDTGPIKAFKGSSRDVLAPIEQSILFIERAERMLIENETMKAMVRFFGSVGEVGGRYVEPIKSTEIQKTIVDLHKMLDDALAGKGVSKTDRDMMMALVTNMTGEDPLLGSMYKSVQTKGRGEPIQFYWDGGVMKAARVISEKEDPTLPLYEMLNAMPQYQRHAGYRTMALASGLLSRSVVSEPTFTVVNFFRDQFVAGVYVPGYIPFISAFKGAKDTYGNSRALHDYFSSGGVSAHHQLLGSEEAARASLDSLAKEGFFVERMTSFKGWGEIITSLELVTRVSAFEKLRKEYRRQGLSDYDALIEARHGATDLLDFGRNGSRLEVARAMTPFLNPYLQGMDKARRSAIAPWVRTIMGREAFDTDREEAKKAAVAFTKFAVLGSGMGLGWAAMNWDSEAYRNADPSLKARYFLFPIGDRMIALPKFFELALPFTLAEMAYGWLVDNDPNTASKMADATFNTLQPPIPFLSNPLIKTPIELTGNTRIFDWEDLYKGAFGESKPIIPERMKGERAETQFLPNTSPLAKKIGKETGLSPIKVDYTIGAFFGGWGKHVMDMSRGMESDSQTKAFEDSAVFKRFVKDPLLVSNAPEQFWKYMSRTTGKFTTAVNSYNRLGQLNDLGVAQQEFFNRLQPNEKAWVTLQRAANPDDPTKLAFKPDDRRVHPFERAREAIGVVNGMTQQIMNKSLKDVDGNPVVLAPPVQKAALTALSKLALMEYRNSLTMTGEPGYTERPLFDVTVPLEILKVQAPQVAKELIVRYANKKIPRTEEVANMYKTLKDTLISDGSRADLSAITDFVRQGGYEFGGERVIIRPRRSIIEGGKK